MEITYTTFDINRILNINRNCLQPWLDGGFITPSIQRATRQGTKNIFSLNDLYKIWLFQKLLDIGVSRREAKDYADVNFESVGPAEKQIKYCTHRWKKKEGTGLMVMSFEITGETELTCEPPTVVLSKDNGFAFVINLLVIKEEVDTLI